MLIFIFIISIIIHECIHILAGVICGYKLKNFKFVPFGTAIEFEDNSYNNAIKNIFIYIVGPLSNFFISYLIYITNIKFKEEIFYTNLILGIFNLLPLNPLDGGKILAEILKLIFNNKEANMYSYIINKVFLCFFTFLYSILIIKIKNISLVFLLAYLWYLDLKEYKRIVILKRVYSLIEKSNF